MNEQTQQADDPSGPGWRDVGPDEILQTGDMFWLIDHWEATQNVGTKSFRYGTGYRRRIEQPQSKPEANPDDPSGDGWRWVRQGEALRHGDVEHIDGDWHPTTEAGYTCPRNHSYRRRIEPQQPSDSEPETMEQLRRRLAECEVLLAEADRGGQPVNAELQQLREQVRDLTQQVQCDAVELQQLREQVTTLTQERDRYQSSLRDHYRDGQQRTAEALQTWLRPVLELVAENPDDCSPLAVAVLGYLPGIASRLIEE